MHTESSTPRHSVRAYVLRMVIAAVVSLLVLAVHLPSLSRPLGLDGTLAIGICLAPLAVIISGVLARHHGLETTGWGALLAIFLLRFFA
jgi:hypothetical protein